VPLDDRWPHASVGVAATCRSGPSFVAVGMVNRHSDQVANVVAVLPADGHVHSQFSWDAPHGDMHATCARAMALGLPALAFTEHLDLTPWTLRAHPVPPGCRGRADARGRYLGEALDVAAHLERLLRCQQAFPGLVIWSGLEISEPHWHPREVAEVVAAVSPQRVIASVHALADVHLGAADGGYVEVGDGFDQRPAVEVVRAYLAEVTAMCTSRAPFDVLGHIDYPLRYWPKGAGPVPWEELADDFRAALEAAAAAERVLEVNTRVPLPPRVLSWWHQAGGQAVVFGSDAHRPLELGRGLVEAAAMVSAHGFVPGQRPFEPWRRGPGRGGAR